MTRVEPPPFAPPALAFGAFELHRDGRLLTRAGGAVALSPSQHAVLSVLVRAGGRVLEKRDLVACGWIAPASIASLARCICTIRRRLREAASGPEVIETVYRRGYRLAVPVARLWDDTRLA